MSEFPQTPSEWVEYLNECDDVEAIPIARAWSRDPGGFEVRWRDKGFPEADVQALVAKCRELRSKIMELPGAQLLGWARAAQVTPLEPIGDQEVDEPPGESMPRYPTGLTRLDHLTAGGGYGMTVIAGRPKCGKSMLAMSTALEASRAGWKTLYLNGELTRTEIANRVLRFCSDRVPEGVCERMSVHPVELGVSVPGVLQKIQERIGPEDDQLLVVLDSINRIVDMSQCDGSEHGYWHTMREWQEWLRRCSQISEGRFASVVVSELNTGGHIKGRSLEYAADLCVSIEPVKDMPDGTVEISAPYARASAGGSLGLFRLDWASGRFEHVGD